MPRNILYKFLIIICGLSSLASAAALPEPKAQPSTTAVLPGSAALLSSVAPAASRLDDYLPLLQQQRVAIFANNASQVNGQNIVALLQQHQVNVVKIFSPEHGFSGLNDAGASVGNTQEQNLRVISLYGAKNKPSAADLTNVDIIVIDIQDVGVRFYTYISSLQKIMEAAAENNKPLLILDRPNPNGFYIDGPVLESQYKSFVGMQPIPLVYGMTIAEYARMLRGEKWLDLSPTAKPLKLTIIPLQDYRHNQYPTLATKPSPNLPNMSAIYWYPSLGLFEGSKLSVGRGTAMPFQVLGNPNYNTQFSFTPQATGGALNPPFKNQVCRGWDLRMDSQSALAQTNGQIQLAWLIKAYNAYPDHAHFFTSFFTKLAGTKKLQQQIIAGVSESQIRASWHDDLTKFKQIRAKYLLYPDF